MSKWHKYFIIFFLLDKLWKPLRKEVNCFFNQRAALFTVPTFIQHYARLCDRIDEIKYNGPFNLRREMMQRNIALILGKR